MNISRVLETYSIRLSTPVGFEIQALAIQAIVRSMYRYKSHMTPGNLIGGSRSWTSLVALDYNEDLSF
jgi:hypothetical protein